MSEEDWGYDPDWGANCLRRNKILEPYRANRPVCDVCRELENSGTKPKKKIPPQPNVLYIQRKIFI